MAVYIFGIRHHGPGSARSLLAALHQVRPDALLMEGPPEAESLLPLLADQEMKPPVALLLYAREAPQVAYFHPFAVFSPEWQAIQFATRRELPVRFVDLPASVTLAEMLEERKKREPEASPVSLPVPADSDQETDGVQEEALYDDPLSWLARAAGFEDGEDWWEYTVEHRQEPGEIFDAIREAIVALRSELPPAGAPQSVKREEQREACMRQSIREAEKEFKKIAVVCGAWHVPALEERGSAKEDTAKLKGLPRTKAVATCIPWTHSRLSFSSGYRAGVDSPGWYDHLWTAKDQPIVRWMTKVARLLRKEDLDASSAHVIEAVRLAEALASLRDRPFPTLAEVNEAALSVLCHGNSLPMDLIHDRLIVGYRLGSVPADTPMAPLQQDVANEQRRVRLKPEAASRDMDLDLRNPTDLARSHLLHRLNLLGVPWGELKEARRAKGTFHELWTISWEPEFEVTLIERGSWGNTLERAATGYAKHLVRQSKALAEHTSLLERVLLADLPEAAAEAIRRVQDAAALANDVWQLTAALPALANIMRYGDVRGTEAGIVTQIVRGMAARICVGLPLACTSLNDDAARSAYDQVNGVHSALALVQQPDLTEDWHATLSQLASHEGLHGLVAGRGTRLLLDGGVFSPEEATNRFSLALSLAVDPAYSAAWCEGFLAGSGLLLVHDDSILRIIDQWIAGLTPERFVQQLPVLRRTFATFHSPERRQIGERLRKGQPLAVAASVRAEFDAIRAQKALPLLAQLLGLNYNAGESGETSS